MFEIGLIIFIKWILHKITYKGWYAIKPNQPEMESKITVSILQATNWGDCTQDYWNKAKNGKLEERYWISLCRSIR